MAKKSTRLEALHQTFKENGLCKKEGNITGL